MHSLLSSRSTAIVSSTIFNSRELTPVGKAWRGIQRRLNLEDALPFQLGLAASSDSHIWPLSEELAENLALKKETRRPYISVLQDVRSEHPDTPRQIISSHTFPAGDYSTEKDSQYMMKALLFQLILLATQDELEQREPSTEIVLSLLQGTQGFTQSRLIKDLIHELTQWSRVLPHVRRFSG